MPHMLSLENVPMYLDQISTHQLVDALHQTPSIVLLPLGSVEPHGPHMPLGTDRFLSEASALHACIQLRSEDINAWIAPSCAYAVTEFASDFKGALSLPLPLYQDLLNALIKGYHHNGFHHVCLINHHLEPLQLKALRHIKKTYQPPHTHQSISTPAVISKRWGGTLGAEFRSGACHAGAYEGSMILASHHELFQQHIADHLPDLDISLSQAIQDGHDKFLSAGMHEAYTGSPASATIAEGQRLYQCHTHMICTEIKEALL